MLFDVYAEYARILHPDGKIDSFGDDYMPISPRLSVPPHSKPTGLEYQDLRPGWVPRVVPIWVWSGIPFSLDKGEFPLKPGHGWTCLSVGYHPFGVYLDIPNVVVYR